LVVGRWSFVIGLKRHPELVEWVGLSKGGN